MSQVGAIPLLIGDYPIVSKPTLYKNIRSVVVRHHYVLANQINSTVSV